LWIGEVVQYQWQLTRQWVIANGPRFLSARTIAVVCETKTGNVSAMDERPTVVRRREPERGPMKIRISSALATFLAVQAGIIAAVWYLFAY
jgi:hypothetical protein